MIKIRLSSRLIPSISLLSSLAVLLAACSPASGAVSPSQPAAGSSPTILAADSTLTPSLAAVSTEAAGPTPLPIVTSRGPELHATDPTTVSLASGGLQLVEFFRFT